MDIVATALPLLKARLNRPASDLMIDKLLIARLKAASQEFERTGIHLLETSTDDVMLLVDYAAWRQQNRDKPGAMPDWLKLARRERWLAEPRGDAT